MKNKTIIGDICLEGKHASKNIVQMGMLVAGQLDRQKLTHNPSTHYSVGLPRARPRAIEQGDWKTSWPLVGK
jgi:hypothetical protein